MSGLHLAEMQQPLLADERGLSGAAASPYLALYRADPLARIATARMGLPATEAKALLDDLGLSQDAGLRALNLSVATTNKKAKAGERLAPDESERVIGLARMMGQMEAMLGKAPESASPESNSPGSDAPGFDAHAWLGRWLMQPLPALGHRRPAELLDTMEGQALVSQCLARMESGAYT